MKSNSLWTRGLALIGALCLFGQIAWSAPTIFVQNSFLKFGDTDGYVYVGMNIPAGESYNVSAIVVTLDINNSFGVNFVDGMYDPPAMAYFAPPVPPNAGYVFGANSANINAGAPFNTNPYPFPFGWTNVSDFNNMLVPNPLSTSSPAQVVFYTDSANSGTHTITGGASGTNYTLGVLQFKLDQVFTLGTVPVTINPDPIFTNILQDNNVYITSTGNDPFGNAQPGAPILGISNGSIFLPEPTSMVLFSLVFAAGLGYGVGRKKPNVQTI